MEITTSRQLRRAYVMAEWAARGVFPCLKPLPKDPSRPKMDFVNLGKQISITIKTMERQLANYRKENPNWKPRAKSGTKAQSNQSQVRKTK